MGFSRVDRMIEQVQVQISVTIIIQPGRMGGETFEVEPIAATLLLECTILLVYVKQVMAGFSEVVHPADINIKPSITVHVCHTNSG